MADIKGTADLRVDIRLMLDKLTGLKSFKKRLLKDIQAFVKNINEDVEIAPQFTFNAREIEEAISQLEAYGRELRKSRDKIDEDTGQFVLDSESRRSLTDLNKKINLFQNALQTEILGRSPRLDRALQDKRFVRVIEDVQRGYFTDRTGKKTPFSGKDLEQLVRPSVGPRDGKGKLLFRPSDIQNLRLYRQELLGISNIYGQIRSGLESARGGVPAVISPSIREQIEFDKARADRIGKFFKEVEKKPTKSAERQSIQEELAAADDLLKRKRASAIRHYRDLEGLRDRDSINERKRLRGKLRDYGLHSKELIRLEEQRIKEQERFRAAAGRRADKRLAVERQRLASRYIKEAGGVEGITSLARAGVVKTALPGRIRTMQDALVKLNSEFRRLGKGPERDKVGRFIKRLEDRIEAASRDAKDLNRQISELQKRGQRPFLPIGPTAGRKRVVAQKEPSGASPDLGREVFYRRGGFGAADRATRGELPELAAFARAEISRLEAAQKSLSKSSSNYTKQQKRMNRELDLHIRELKRAEVRMDGFYGATNQAASLFRQFFRYALGYGALYQAMQAVRALTMSLVDLETQLKAIQAVTAATRDEINTIEGGIKQVALTTQFNTVEIAQAAQILGQAGVIPKELPKAIEATALFASATGSSIELAADLVTSLRNVFTNLEDNTITNLLTKAINISKLTAQDLKTVVSLSSQIAKSYNLTAEQYFAAVTTLRNAGIKPSTVATGLRQGLIELFSPDSKTVKALVSRYRQLGEQLNEEAVRGRFFAFSLEADPLVSVLRELQRLGFRGEGKQTFQRAYDIRAENAINALIDDIEQLEEASSQLTFGNAAAVAAATQMEALSHSVRNLGAAISVFVHDLAGGVLPVLEDWVDGLTNVIQRYDDLHNVMRRETGLGLEAGAIGGVAGTVAGAALYRGQVLGRIAAAGVGGVVGSRLGAGFAQQKLPEDIKLEEGVPTGFTDHLKELATIILLAMIPAFGRIIKNWYGGAGFRGAIMQAFGAGGKVTGAVDSVMAGSVLGVFKRIGDAIKGAKIGKVTGDAAAVSAGLSVYGRIVGAMRVLGSFVARHPIGFGITALYVAAQAAAKFFDPKAMQKSSKQLEAATKARERAQNELDKLETELENFRPSDSATGYKAKEGTTAASLENLEEQAGRADSELGAIFDSYSERMDDFATELLRLSNEGAIAGSSRRTEILDYLVRPKKEEGFGASTRGLSFAVDDLDARMSAAAADLSAYVRGIQTLRKEWVRYIQQLASKSRKDLSQLERIQLDTVNELLQNEEDFAAIFYGYFDAGTERGTARAVAKRMKAVFRQIDDIARASEEFQNAQVEVLDARAYEIRKFLDRVRDLEPNSPEFQNAMHGVTGAIVGFDQAVIDHLNETKKLIEEGASSASRFAQQTQFRRQLDELRDAYESYKEQPFDPYDSEAVAIRERTLAQFEERERLLEASIVSSRKLRKYEEDQERDQASAAKTTEGIDRQLQTIEETNKKREVAEENIVRTLQERSRDPKFLAAFRDYVPPAKPGVSPTPNQLAAEALQGRFFGATPEKLVRVTKDGALDYDPILAPFKDNLEGVLNSVTQLFEKRRGEQVFSTVTRPELLEKIESSRFAVEQAEAQNRYKELGTETDQTTNLYRQLQNLLNQERDYKIHQLNKEIRFLGPEDEKSKRNAIEIQKLDNDKKREITNTDIKIAQAKERVDREGQTRLNKARSAEIAGLQTELRGKRKQLRLAEQSGDFEKGLKLDGEIVSIKEMILKYRLQEFESVPRDPKEVREFEERMREDMRSAFESPNSLQAFFSGARRQIEYQAPSIPDLSESPREAGQLEVLGVEPDLQQLFPAYTDRIELMELYADAIEKVVNEAERAGRTTPESIRSAREGIKELRIEIGKLSQERDNLRLSAEGFNQQLALGFDPGQIANKVRSLNSHFTNLGQTIQDDIVGGLDEAADSFSNALVRGEDFADGVQQALSDMAYQVAADIVKSGIMSLIGSLIGGTVGGPGGAAAGSQAGAASAGGSQQQGGFLSNFFASFGFAKGGVVEKKAKGGQIGGSPAGEVSSSPAGSWTSLLKLFKGGRVEKRAGGGLIKGPGTGTSDSIPGVVVNKQGRAVRGIKVSTGESILTAKTTSGVGKSGIDKLNDLGTRGLARLRAFLGTMPGYKEGGTITNQTFSASEFSRITTAPPLAFASGGTIGEMRGQTTKMRMPERAESGSGHTYRAEVMIGAQEGADVDPNTLRKMDEGITLRVKEFVQEQMRPGGMLQGSRATAGRG